MRRDITRKKFGAKRISPTTRFVAGQARWRWLLLIGVLAILLFGVGIFINNYKKQTPMALKVSGYFSQITSWITERKNHFRHNLTKAKPLATNKIDEEPQIHFEFYNTLPNMKVAVSVDANELEKELAKHIKQNTYIVQAGIFKNFEIAERFRHSLAAKGLVVGMVKLSNAERNIYRVQLGPFSNKEQAKLAERQLQKNGVSGIIRKVE